MGYTYLYAQRTLEDRIIPPIPSNLAGALYSEVLSYGPRGELTEGEMPASFGGTGGVSVMKSPQHLLSHLAKVRREAPRWERMTDAECQTGSPRSHLNFLS